MQTMKTNRRTFVIQSVVGTAGLLAMNASQAQAALLLESNSQAKTLGYRADASQVERASFAKYAPGQKCTACQMFRAQQPATAAGQCAIFPGKLVSADGWCDAFTQRA
jgi:hypothetical protein